jgi:PAS domain S-box-containing protein
MTRKSKFITFIAGAGALLGLYLLSLHSYLLFHTIAEVFSIVIAFCIFIIAWNSRHLMENNALLFLGIAYLFVGTIDLIHTLAYSGMGVFPGRTTNLATQLWIAARYMESVSLLIAPLFLGRRLRAGLVMFTYAAVSALFLLAIFGWHIFPVCFVEGKGLTPFKKISEYAISLVLIGAIANIFRRRDRFDPAVLRLIIASMLVTVASELAFTFYISAYGLSNLIGHYFKIVSFYLIYKALIETGLKKPYNLLFRELKQRERALSESEERYRAIFENTGTATLIIEDDMMISLVNSEFEKLSGYSKQEVEGRKRWTEFVSGDSLEMMKSYHEARRIDPEGAPGRYDFKFISRDGVAKDIHMQVGLIPGTTRSVASAIDITARKRAEEIIKRDKETLSELVRRRSTELVEAYKRLSEARRLSGIGMLAATVAHEIRSPLGTMLTAVHNIRRKNEEPGLNRHLDNIEKKIIESDQIVSNLLRYAKIRPPNHEKADLRQLLADCIESAVTRFSGYGITVDVNLEGASTKPVEIDVVQMTEVFNNILNNAYQAVDKNTGRIKVTASVENDGNVEVRVCDNGCGIDENDLPMLFEPFFTKKAKGTGLGLSICRDIIRLHGGEVKVESKPGERTSVIIVFPAKKAPPRDVASLA